METLLLHLDEELVNSRPGRIIRSNYDEHELAFWTLFYSLFYDTVYVPANFLTDSNMTPLVLKRMGIENPQSAIHAEDGPFKILWDISRFPADNFYELVKMLASDQTYISMRDIEIARTTARLCDRYLRGRIIRVDMTAKLDPKESVEQLSREVFDPSENKALLESETSRLSECLQKIVSRGDILGRGERFGYGRNFYYTIFGYGKTRAQQNLAERFEDIVNEYIDLRPQFLTSVDYVSHRLKAKFASRALNREIGVLIPNEYNWIVVPASKSIALASGLGKVKQVEVEASGKFRYLLNREAVINMTAKQLTDLHTSDEYKKYKVALDEIRKYRSLGDDLARKRREKTLEDSLGAYLERISSTLNPKRYAAGKVLKIAAEGIPTLLGYTARIVLEGVTKIGGAPTALESRSDTISQGVELFSSNLTGKVAEKLTREENFQCNTIQLTEDVRVYLE
jgi:hypothetical protein